MVKSLPKWVEYSAFALALLAGMVNAIGLLGFQHQSVSHLSGTATQLGVAVFHHPLSALHLLAIILSFFFGAAVSGYALSGHSLKLGRHYDTLLMIEGVLLVFSVIFLQWQISLGIYCASAACGVQNAMVTSYSGAVIRTTHVTGIVTDLGLLFGAKLRGEKVDSRRVVMFLLIVCGFVLGGALGALSFTWWVFYALLVPAAMSFIMALGYRLLLIEKRV